MIYLKKDTVNRVVLTLTESSTLNSPFYLFEFTKEFQAYPNQDVIYFTTDDLSTVSSRYNLFEIELSSTGSTTGGTSVSLNLESGQYKYQVYEASASTLSISATTGSVVERGRMIVELSNESKINTNNIYN
jgi:hypothetical protein